MQQTLKMLYQSYLYCIYWTDQGLTINILFFYLIYIYFLRMEDTSLP